jgi:hypothetical protein
MSAVTAVVVVLTLAVAVFAGPIYRFAERTAGDLLATSTSASAPEAP